jgi:hypothetical protein
MEALFDPTDKVYVSGSDSMAVFGINTEKVMEMVA